jgi:2-keto-3-deoxy-L-rhamnonate aldolase RhmA
VSDAFNGTARHGKALGMGGINDDENARRYIGKGARFITSGNDHGFIVAGSIERADFYCELAVEAAGRRTGGSAKTR